MRYRVLSFISVLAMVAALMGITSPVAAVAYGTSFTTSITYMNIGTASANISLQFYNEANGTAIPINLPTLAVNAGSSLYIGGVSDISTGFRGSAVMSSSEPLAATMVQLAPAGSTVKNRPLSNGFNGGAAYVLLPTALKNPPGTNSTNSIISIQNVDGVGADITVKFVPLSGSSITETVNNLPANSSKYFDLGSLSSLGSAFNGSVQITAKKTGTSTDGLIVASSMELGITNDEAYAFEGFNSSGPTVFMPSAFCNQGVGNAVNSYYAVQNTDTADVDVTITYSNGNTDGPVTIGGGAKVSFPGCGRSGTVNPAGFLGSAKITTSAGGKIVAVGKVKGNGLSTAFNGVFDGAEKLFLPYVRFTTSNWYTGTRQRTYIAIQNVGAAPLNAGDVTVKYYDKDGNLVGTDTLGAMDIGAKLSSNAGNIGAGGAEFGYYGTAIGGGAVIEGPVGSKLAVVARVQTYIGNGATVGEDYNGMQ